MALFRKKSLLQRDPTTLSVEDLELLQRGLIVKLIKVNSEIRVRCNELASLGLHVNNADDAVRALQQSSTRCARLNDELDAYLNGPPGYPN